MSKFKVLLLDGIDPAGIDVIKRSKEIEPLVYDKISFVSAKDWIANPTLKQAALAVTVASGFDDYSYQPLRANKSRTVVVKKARPRITRAD